MGSDQEFERFYEAHRDRLVVTLCGLTGDVEAAADAVDEAMTRAYERWRRVGRSAEPAGWVYVTARNIARRRFRRRQRERVASEASSVAAHPGVEIWLVVADLPPRQREAVALRHLLGLTEQGVAEAMGVTRGTVSSTLRDAYGTLAPQLAAVDDNDEETVA